MTEHGFPTTRPPPRRARPRRGPRRRHRRHHRGDDPRRRSRSSHLVARADGVVAGLPVVAASSSRPSTPGSAPARCGSTCTSRTAPGSSAATTCDPARLDHARSSPSGPSSTSCPAPPASRPTPGAGPTRSRAPARWCSTPARRHRDARAGEVRRALRRRHEQADGPLRRARWSRTTTSSPPGAHRGVRRDPRARSRRCRSRSRSRRRPRRWSRSAGARFLLCDNMSTDLLRATVDAVRGTGEPVEVEATGGLTLEVAAAYAATGVGLPLGGRPHPLLADPRQRIALHLKEGCSCDVHC